tara:strand:- start:899 stop:1645 length:747 start_codon:yes stop_codon:yes gene_type:complete
MKLLLPYLVLTLSSFSIFAKDKVLTYSYWHEAGPPFVFLEGEGLKDVGGGIVRDLADLISSRLNVSSHFVNIPVQRTNSQLSSGAIDLNCITSPIWKENPDDFYWSPALFKGSDRFLVKSSEEHNLVVLDDLKGKTLGIYKGYTYHSKIMAMIDNAEIKTIKISDLDHGIKLLLLDRIDALIDFDILLNYKIKEQYSGTLALADLYADSFELFCAYSKKIKTDKAQLDKMFKDLVNEGEIAKLLKRYN